MDEVRGFFPLRVDFEVLLDLAVNELQDHVHVGQDLLHLEWIARQVLEERHEVQGGRAYTKISSRLTRATISALCIGYSRPLHRHPDKRSSPLLVVYTIVGHTFLNSRYLGRNKHTINRAWLSKCCDQLLSFASKHITQEA